MFALSLLSHHLLLQRGNWRKRVNQQRGAEKDSISRDSRCLIDLQPRGQAEVCNIARHVMSKRLVTWKLQLNFGHFDQRTSSLQVTLARTIASCRSKYMQCFEFTARVLVVLGFGLFVFAVQSTTRNIYRNEHGSHSFTCVTETRRHFRQSPDLYVPDALRTDEGIVVSKGVRTLRGDQRRRETRSAPQLLCPPQMAVSL